MHIEIKAGTNNIHPSSAPTGNLEINLVCRNLVYAEKTPQTHGELCELNPGQACSVVLGASLHAT